MDTHETRRCIQSRQSRLTRPPASRPIAARVPQGPSLRPLRGCGTRARAAVGRPHAPSALLRAHAHPDEDMRPPWPCSIRCSAVRFIVDLQDTPAEGSERKGSGWQGGQGGRGRAAATRCGWRAATHPHWPGSHSRTNPEPPTFCLLSLLLHRGSRGPCSASVMQIFAFRNDLSTCRPSDALVFRQILRCITASATKRMW